MMGLSSVRLDRKGKREWACLYSGFFVGLCFDGV
jgi:hypothetical protein